MTDADGRRESISQKCADIDKQMPELLGIAAPILDNVVFCHQEESAWPLQDGATLKKKFDDIFDSTRYTKALEAITKTQKELQGRSKDMKAEVAELGAHLHTSTVIKKELKGLETKVQECREEIEFISEKESSVQEKVNPCTTQFDSFSWSNSLEKSSKLSKLIGVEANCRRSRSTSIR